MALSTFEPLGFEAGVAAGNWLRVCLTERKVALETQLAFGEDPRRLLGLYVIRPAAFTLSVRERRRLGIGRRSADRHLPGMYLELIARARETPPGFGDQLVTHALANTLDRRAVALVIEASEEVATAVWQRHRFVPFTDGKPRGSETMMLWHPVREPEPDDAV
ncbi:MAG TPA: hypothetical protein VF715_08530 [Thermoleophilaceae bacterium]